MNRFLKSVIAAGAALATLGAVAVSAHPSHDNDRRGGYDRSDYRADYGRRGGVRIISDTTRRVDTRGPGGMTIRTLVVDVRGPGLVQIRSEEYDRYSRGRGRRGAQATCIVEPRGRGWRQVDRWQLERAANRFCPRSSRVLINV